MALNDRELLAKTLQAEAGNQGLQGMLAAGSVIMNRVNLPGYGNGLQDVILKPGQFSAWNKYTGYAGGEQGQNMAAITPSQQAYQVAEMLLSGKYEDPTKGATHYYNPDISTPSWGSQAGGDWLKIGSHIFGTPNGKPTTTKEEPDMNGPASTAAPNVGAPPSMNPPQPQQRSGGLLGNLLGNRGSISGGILGGLGMDEDQADRFRMAILAGTGDARMAPLIQATQARMQERKAKAATQGQINKTVQWLSSNNRQDLANLVMQGLMTPAAAVQEARAKPEQVRGIEVDGNILNPYTGEIIYQAPPKGVDQKQIVEARKEFTGLKPVKDFADVTFAYSRVVTSAQDPSPAGDLALIFNYMKVLDPGSVVREGEFATAQNAGGVDDRVRSLYNRVVAGTRLSEPQRADFVDRASRLYQGAEKQYKSIADQYSELAEKAGLPVDQVIPDFTFKGTAPERSTLLQVPANPDKSRFPTDDDWKTHWQTVMTEDQRREYLEG